MTATQDHYASSSEHTTEVILGAIMVLGVLAVLVLGLVYLWSSRRTGRRSDPS